MEVSDDMESEIGWNDPERNRIWRRWDRTGGFGKVRKAGGIRGGVGEGLGGSEQRG